MRLPLCKKSKLKTAFFFHLNLVIFPIIFDYHIEDEYIKPTLSINNNMEHQFDHS